jgi:DNA-binding transcriptional regulator LsrR (DeoR family)
MPKHPPHIEPRIIYEVCCQFMADCPLKEIQAWLQSAGVQNASREMVYKLVRQGVQTGFIRLCAPLANKLERELNERFSGVKISVLDVAGECAKQSVARHGAQKILEFVMQFASDGKKDVQIGMGAGYVTQDFAGYFAQLLRPVTGLPTLVLQALTSGFLVKSPETAPVSFFSLFKNLDNIEYIGLFAPAWVDCQEYSALKHNPCMKEAFELAANLDIVVTSFASADDEHGLYNRFIRKYGKDENIHALRKAGWVGDILWQPFSSAGPIHIDTGVRAVSLFELDELMKFAATPGKHVVCFAAPCSVCGENKAAALLPLLENPQLRVFNHLIMDRETASTVARLC